MRATNALGYQSIVCGSAPRTAAATPVSASWLGVYRPRWVVADFVGFHTKLAAFWNIHPDLTHHFHSLPQVLIFECYLLPKCSFKPFLSL